MKVFYSDEKTAEEYLEEGAVDVLAFGPILIRDGELNEEGIAKYGTSHAQRTAVGMVEKGHYWFMMLEGRIKRSTGDGIGFLAEKLMEKQCAVGFNLDGGDTSCIVFMGHQLCTMQNGKKHLSSRRTSDILGVGTSELLPALSDPW
jgi:exopolysaccharide biosynthesis protein